MERAVGRRQPMQTRVDTCGDVGGGARHGAALENDVFTGRHRTRTTPSAVLQAGWTRRWRDAQRVAEVFVEVFENAQKNENTINDSACMLLVRAARALPDVGAYIGAHLVRSLLAVRFDITFRCLGPVYHVR